MTARSVQPQSTRSSPRAFLTGWCTLIATVGWGCWVMWCFKTITMRALLLYGSMQWGYMMEAENPQASSEAAVIRPAPVDISDVADPVAEARRLLVEGRQKRAELQARLSARRKEQLQAFNRRMADYRTACTVISISWLAVMIISGIVMFAASVSGFLRSRRSRGWHWAVVWMTLFSSLWTLASMWGLTRWAGFPSFERDNWSTLALVAGIQSSYALLLAVVLLATRRGQEPPQASLIPVQVHSS